MRRVAALYNDLTLPAARAGVTAFVWYAFGCVPLLVSVAGQLGLSATQSSSWLFVVWFTGAVSSIALSLAYRQPIPIASTVPGLVYLCTLAGRFTFSELAGANLMAGVAILILGLLGLGVRLIPVINRLPPPRPGDRPADTRDDALERFPQFLQLFRDLDHDLRHAASSPSGAGLAASCTRSPGKCPA